MSFGLRYLSIKDNRVVNIYIVVMVLRQKCTYTTLKLEENMISCVCEAMGMNWHTHKHEVCQVR